MKAVLILVMLMLSACGPMISKTTPPASVVCPASAMAKCDTKYEPVPDAMAADDAVDRLILAIAQRNQCDQLNDAKAECLTNGKKSK